MDNGADDAAPRAAGGRDSGLRDALDSLIHGPAPKAPRDPVSDASFPSLGSDSGAARRGAGSRRPPPVARISDDLTGLYTRDAWTAVLAAEEARSNRFHHPYQVVQLEVGGIDSIEGHLGEPFAERLVALLATVLRDETRETDAWARTGRWRIQGLLPEQQPQMKSQIEARIRDRFRESVGPGLPVGLRIGMAASTANEAVADLLTRAERAMGPGEALAPVAEGPADHPALGTPDRSADVRDSLATIGTLRDDGLIDTDEYRRKRAEILERL